MGEPARVSVNAARAGFAALLHTVAVEGQAMTIVKMGPAGNPMSEALLIPAGRVPDDAPWETVSVTEARAQLSYLVERATSGHGVFIARLGRRFAAIVPPDAFSG